MTTISRSEARPMTASNPLPACLSHLEQRDAAVRLRALEEAAKACEAASEDFLNRRDALRIAEEGRLRMAFERIATQCRSLAAKIRALGRSDQP